MGFLVRICRLFGLVLSEGIEFSIWVHFCFVFANYGLGRFLGDLLDEAIIDICQNIIFCTFSWRCKWNCFELIQFFIDELVISSGRIYNRIVFAHLQTFLIGVVFVMVASIFVFRGVYRSVLDFGFSFYIYVGFFDELREFYIEGYGWLDRIR